MENMNKKRDLYQIINFMISCIALAIAYYAATQTRAVTEYQITQERMPMVTCLEQIIVVQADVDNQSSGAVKSFEIQDSEHNTFTIPIYNVGVGIAKNCSVTWETQSVRAACLQAKDLMKAEDPLLVCEYSWATHPGPSVLVAYPYDFLIENGDLKRITYYDADAATLISDSVDDCAPVRYPYLLPVTNQLTQASIPLPYALSLLITELGNQQIIAPISVLLTIRYQDLADKEYNSSIEVTFTPSIPDNGTIVLNVTARPIEDHQS